MVIPTKAGIHSSLRPSGEVPFTLSLSKGDPTAIPTRHSYENNPLPNASLAIYRPAHHNPDLTNKNI